MFKEHRRKILCIRFINIYKQLVKKMKYFLSELYYSTLVKYVKLQLILIQLNDKILVCF